MRISIRQGGSRRSSMRPTKQASSARIRRTKKPHLRIVVTWIKPWTTGLSFHRLGVFSDKVSKQNEQDRDGHFD